LQVTAVSDVSLNGHVSRVYRPCFFWRNLKDESIVPWTLNQQTLVHAFVTLRVDYSKSMLANVPKMVIGYIVTDQLQQVLNAAACSMSK